MKLQLAKGTRDFSPEEKIVRDEIMQVLKEVCELYGFNPIETPVIERLDTLSAKFAAGEGSDVMKEVFKLSDQGKRKLALRYDLTVPFSRYVAMNKSIKMPFKKYIVGEVFRDGPIKLGRYRQFTQFDPDIVGCKAMTADAEILSLFTTAFTQLGLKYYIELNNKKIIDGVLEDAKVAKSTWNDITISIDKLKKVGVAGVSKELKSKGLKKKQIDFILATLTKEKTNSKTVAKLKKSIESRIGLEGVREVEEVLTYADTKNIAFEPSLARGLAYYTGTIFEAFLKKSKITSSIAGGGRYDRMIADYMGRDEDVPAVGGSFGIETLIEAYREQGKIAKKSVVQVYVVPIGQLKEGMKVVQKFRNLGVKADVDLLNKSISKNLAYANSYGIPFVAFLGEDEVKKSKVKLKNMNSGEEKTISVERAVKILGNF